MRLACRPCSTPIGRGATCALAAWPLAASPSTRPSRRRQPSGLEWPCASDTENGRPDAVSSRSIISNSLSGLGVLKSEMNSMTPRPASFMPSAMPKSSASEARSEGVGSPFTVRWLSVREVEKPSAPARMASAVSARISATSSAVASSSFAARSPMTNTRSAPCGSWAPRSMSRGLRLQRVEILAEGFPRPVQPLVERRAGNVLDAFHQFDQALAVLDLHRREADAAIAHHRRGDAMPARRLQMRIPGRLAVIVGVDVDEARRDQQALGVDLLVGAAGDLADGGDLAVLHRDIGFVQAPRRCRRPRCRRGRPDRIPSPCSLLPDCRKCT